MSVFYRKYLVDSDDDERVFQLDDEDIVYLQVIQLYFDNFFFLQSDIAVHIDRERHNSLRNSSIQL